MAKSYIITIVDDTQEKRSAVARTPSGESVIGKKDSGKSQKPKLAAYYYAKRALQTAASYDIDTIEIRTGSVRAQQNAQFAYQVVNDIYNIGESIVVGAMAGGAVGAVVGAVVGTVQKVVNIATASSKQNLSRSVENITLAQNAIRIGAGGDRMGAVK